MTKLEQVARAIAKSEGLNEDWTKQYLRHARAAVEALREPSEAMLDAGNRQLDCANERQCWQAMLDAILSEKPE
jgi:hypothetical protein